MKYNVEMLKKVDETLENSRIFIEEKQLVKVVSTFNKFSSSFNKFFLTLSSEKIINMDPYGEDHNLKKLELPDQSEVPYNEEEYTVSIRLTHYNSLLNYIKDNNLICIDFLTPDKFPRLEKIVQFLDWDRVFDPQPHEINTEAINKVLFSFQKEHDPKFIIESLKASTKDINIYKNEFLKEITPVKLFVNEKYKLFIREQIIDFIKLPQELKGENIKKAHDAISKKVKEMGVPLYIELIGEVLKEDYSHDGDILKKKILDDLVSIDGSLVKNISNNNKPKIDPKDLLNNSFNELSKATSQMESILTKTIENASMYRSENYTLIEKIIDYIKYNVLSQKRVTHLSIEIQNSDDKIQNKSIDLEKFIISLKSLDKRLNQYKSQNNSAHKELFEKDENEIKTVLHLLLSKCRYKYKILVALDKFFKDNLKSSKGIRIELKVYLSSLDKSQEIYFEYTKLKSDTQDDSIYKPDINLTT